MANETLENAITLVEGMIETAPFIAPGVGGYTRLALSTKQIIDRVEEVTKLLKSLREQEA